MLFDPWEPCKNIAIRRHPYWRMRTRRQLASVSGPWLVGGWGFLRYVVGSQLVYEN